MGLGPEVEKAIGVFDSGLGGLTVLREVIKALPDESTIYLGDTARVPYGTKSPETVTKYALECARFLLKREIKVLIVACNTVSAVGITVLKKTLSLPVIGVLEPGSKGAVGATRNGRVGVIGTEATIKSLAYPKAIKVLNKRLEVISQACPLFVPLVEEGWIDNEIALLVAERYLSTLRRDDIDTLVLGCTHYPLLKEVIGKVMGEGVRLIDSAEETAQETRRVLEEMGLLRKRKGPIFRQYYVTDIPQRFKEIGGRFLGERLEGIKQVELQRYKMSLRAEGEAISK